jgi:hypothetical protein
MTRVLRQKAKPGVETGSKEASVYQPGEGEYRLGATKKPNSAPTGPGLCRIAIGAEVVPCMKQLWDGGYRLVSVSPRPNLQRSVASQRHG